MASEINRQNDLGHCVDPSRDDAPLTRRTFGLAAGRTILGLVGLALILPATTGHATRQRSAKWRLGGRVTADMRPGALCIVTSGKEVANGISVGYVVRFVRAPIPGTAAAIFQYAPGIYAYSHSDGQWVGKDNAHYCCIIDRTRLRLLERT